MQKSHTKIILQNKSTFPRRYKETVAFLIYFITQWRSIKIQLELKKKKG